jgi:phosphoglycerate kinase
MVENDSLHKASELIQRAKNRGCKLLFPVDSVIADAFDADANSAVCDADKTPGYSHILPPSTF